MSLQFDSIKAKVLNETIPPKGEPGSIVSPEVHLDRRVSFRFVGQDAGDVKASKLVSRVSRHLGRWSCAPAALAKRARFGSLPPLERPWGRD